jgi:hypothetical protein
MIKFYQITLGLLFRGNCRFYPSCSEYMIQAIKKHGIWSGLYKGTKRLSKCHPYSKHFGVDEV